MTFFRTMSAGRRLSQGFPTVLERTMPSFMTILSTHNSSMISYAMAVKYHIASQQEELHSRNEIYRRLYNSGQLDIPAFDDGNSSRPLTEEELRDIFGLIKCKTPTCEDEHEEIRKQGEVLQFARVAELPPSSLHLQQRK
jgi:hypothetical protein